MCDYIDYYENKLAKLDANLEIIKELQESEDKEHSIIELKKRIERDIAKIRIEEALDGLNCNNLNSLITLCNAKRISDQQVCELTSELNKNLLDFLSRLDSYI